MVVDDVRVCAHLGLSSVSASFILRSSLNPYLLRRPLHLFLQNAAWAVLLETPLTGFLCDWFFFIYILSFFFGLDHVLFLFLFVFYETKKFPTPFLFKLLF